MDDIFNIDRIYRIKITHKCYIEMHCISYQLENFKKLKHINISRDQFKYANQHGIFPFVYLRVYF